MYVTPLSTNHYNNKVMQALYLIICVTFVAQRAISSFGIYISLHV